MCCKAPRANVEIKPFLTDVPDSVMLSHIKFIFELIFTNCNGLFSDIF